MRRAAHTVLFGAIALAVVVAAASAAGATGPATLTNLTAWAAGGSRFAFVATVHGKTALWTQRFGAAAPTRLGPPACVKEEQIDALAPGPKGSWGCLEGAVGNTESYFSVGVVASTGVSRRVATAGGSTAAANDSIPVIVGDGSTLYYLHLTAGGITQLMRVSGTRALHVADIAAISNPQTAAIGGGHIAIADLSGTVVVVTARGATTSTIMAKAASVAVTGSRVVVRTRDRRLATYTFGGALVHSFPLGAGGWTAGLGAYGNTAVYLAANKALRAVDLATGRDRIVLRSGSGWFFNGLAMLPAGAVVPVTTQRGHAFSVTFRFVPMRALP